MLCIFKLKHDLRSPDETQLARRELEALVEGPVEPVACLSSLIKKRPFTRMNDELIHVITRLPYLGDVEGYLSDVSEDRVIPLVERLAFFKEIFTILEGTEDEVRSSLARIGLPGLLETGISSYARIFRDRLRDGAILVTIRLLPFHALFEYASELLKLPDAIFLPRNGRRDPEAVLSAKEKGIDDGIEEMFAYLQSSFHRSPHFGLGKNSIGDYIDWAYTTLRKPFLHYLHRFKGKGDPRLSRALLNLARIAPGQKVLDPFVGSGAFLIDAGTMGINSVGVDSLPLACLISRVKCNHRMEPAKLRKALVQLMNDTGEMRDADPEPILREFKRQGLKVMGVQPLEEILHIKKKIDGIEDDEARDFLQVILSEIVAQTRRRSRVNVRADFRSYAINRYLMVYATRKVAERLGLRFEGRSEITLGDARNLKGLDEVSFDGAVTSPPYFDALDYIGDNLHSTIILGMAQGGEQDPIRSSPPRPGSFESRRALPRSSEELIRRMTGNSGATRARATHSYLLDMRESFKEVHRVLKKGARYVMVVSKFHRWKVGGEEIEVDSSRILADIGREAGFRLVEEIEHGLSKTDKGSIRTESILIFEKP